MVYSQMMREKESKDDKLLPRYRATAKRFQINRIRVDAVVEKGWEIYNLECKILGMEDGPEKDAALEKLHEMEREFEEGRSQLNANFRPAVYTELDDRISMSTVPRLQWDMRPFEPLVAKPEEVWPENQVRLYDMLPQPKPDDLSLEDWEYEQDFVAAINDTGGRTMSAVPQILDTVQHGGSALIDEIPILRDPKRGGRLNMEQMRSRMLTLDMIQAMSKAYREWPFRIPEADYPNYFRTRDGRRGGISNRRGVMQKLRKAS
jgi:transcription factor 1